MNNTIKDFDLDLKTNKKDTATPYVGSLMLVAVTYVPLVLVGN